MNRFLLACLLLTPAFAAADERILSFDSNIVVRQDGSIEVTETIRVRAEGKQIRRGIYRDFPTDYEDKSGNDYHVRFTRWLYCETISSKISIRRKWATGSELISVVQTGLFHRESTPTHFVTK